MFSHNKNNNRRSGLSFIVFFSVASLLLWSTLRLVLLLETGVGQVGMLPALKAFGMGLWFDVATLAFLLPPFLLVSASFPSRWRSSRLARYGFWMLAWISLFLLMFGAVAEFVFWQEFSTRFNFIAVDYLIYTTEVVGNIVQSYPVGWILAAIAALAMLLVGLVSRRYAPVARPLITRTRRWGLVALAVLLPAMSMGLSDADQMNVTGNAYADELAGNGLYTLAAAMRRNELDYDRFYKTMPQAQADAILQQQGVEREPLSHEIADQTEVHEPEEMGPFQRKPRNIVLISVESLSAKFLGSYGDARGLTPNLDRIAAEGLRFERVFATGTRTVRGLDALSLAIPPIPGQAVVRRQNNEHLATVGEFLEQQGYATFFFYGGYGYFDNMNAYFEANDYRVIDRTHFSGKPVFENVWGVADEVLFDNTLPVLDATANAGRPFFAHIMTTSNHRPYTYPDGRIDIPSPGGRSGAVKYTDYAIGRFIDEAKRKPWFADTLFVFVADHCASVAGKTRLPMDRYHIPLIFYAPGMLKPGTYPRMVSQIDIAPTLLDLVGKNGDDHFFGQSMFEAAAHRMPERAFISNYQQLGYYKDGLLTVLAPRQQVQAFRIDPATYQATPAETNPELADETVAFYQTAARAFKRGALREQMLNSLKQ